jgi:hypothetical protein
MSPSGAGLTGVHEIFVGTGWSRRVKVGFSSYREDKQHARTMMNPRSVVNTNT